MNEKLSFTTEAIADWDYKRNSVKRMNDLGALKALADSPHFTSPLLLQFFPYPIAEIAQFWLLWSALTFPQIL